jgi:hypothetical protein
LEAGRRLKESSSRELAKRGKENIMIRSAFTLFHVALSLLGILSGFVAGFLTAKRSSGWTGFL